MLDRIDALERLQKLKEAGAINETEFEFQKSKILSQEDERQISSLDPEFDPEPLNDAVIENEPSKNATNILTMLVYLIVTIFVLFLYLVDSNFLGLANILSWIAITVSVFLVFKDAAYIDNQGFDWGRLKWTVLTVVVWVVAFPAYIFQRASFIEDMELKYGSKLNVLVQTKTLVSVFLSTILLMLLGLFGDGYRNFPNDEPSHVAEMEGMSEATISNGQNLSITSKDILDGRCKLVVGQKSYIDGNCLIELSSDGSFSVFENTDRSGYFTIMQREGDGGMGYWNGSRNSTHAQDSLGELTREGACWVNSESSSKICAWDKPSNSNATNETKTSETNRTVWDCTSVYGETILVTLDTSSYVFSPRNPDGGELYGKLEREPPETFEETGDIRATLNLIGSKSSSWSMIYGDAGPALFNFSELSGDGSECTLPGQAPKYSFN